MTKKKVEAKKQGRTRYSAEYKQQALLRAVKEGIPAVALDLGLEPAQFVRVAIEVPAARAGGTGAATDAV